MIKRCIAVLVAVMLHACAPVMDKEPSQPPVHLAASCAERDVHVSIVGDSLARGWGASSPRASFAALVFADVRQSHPRAVLHNLGIPGATTDEIAAKEMPHLRSDDCAVVFLISGANDVQKLYTPRHFQSSYNALLHKIRTHVPKAAVIVIGLPNIALSPLIPAPLKPIEAALSKSDNVAIEQAARRNGAAFVPLYELSQKYAGRWKSLISRDGIHPNEAGYRLMATVTMPAIAEMVTPSTSSRVK